MTKARDLANSAAAFSAVSATELGYVDGVTSAIQTQLDAKAASSTAVTLTGTQTLTNKTLTSPALTTPTISTLTTAGDTVYGTGSGVLSRLGIGTAGQVLTVNSGATAPQWSTAAGGGGMTLLDTVTLSGASVTSGTLSTSYKNLQIIIKNQKDNSGDTLSLRLNGDTGSKYYYQEIDQTYRTSEIVTYFNSATSGNTTLRLGAGNGTATDGLQAAINLFRYADTGNAVLVQADLFFREGPNPIVYRASTVGFYVNTAAITSVTFAIGSGSFSSGTMYIYGVS